MDWGGEERVRPKNNAAAEAAVALAITLNFYNTHATVDIDRAEDLKG